MGDKDIMIFACSAHAFESDVSRSFEESLDGQISKPIEAGELIALPKDAALRTGHRQMRETSHVIPLVRVATCQSTGERQ